MADLPPDPTPGRHSSGVLWLGNVLGSLAFLLITLLRTPQRGADAGVSPELMFGFALGVSLLGVLGSRLLPLRAHPEIEPADVRAHRRQLLSMLLCEIPCLVAIGGHTLTRDDRLYAVFAVAFGGLLSLFPTPGRWERLKVKGDGPLRR